MSANAKNTGHEVVGVQGFAGEISLAQRMESRKSNILCLPVSLGEAIDKLTILDIKLQKIHDDRKFDVRKEYDLLYESLKQFVVHSPEKLTEEVSTENHPIPTIILRSGIDQYSDLYETMKQVNLLIWDMMDLLRDSCLAEEDYLRICKECIEFNDIRFRVKNKINYASNSELREQKGYRTNRILVDVWNQDPEFFIIPIKYFSFIYDEIVIVSDNVALKTAFSYDPTIKFIGFTESGKSDSYTSPQIEYKRMFVFGDGQYSQSEIYGVFGLDDATISRIICNHYNFSSNNASTISQLNTGIN
jgi:hypothetical protein